MMTTHLDVDANLLVYRDGATICISIQLIVSMGKLYVYG